MTFLRDCGVGWIAGACGVAATHPLDTLRVRQQHLSGPVGTSWIQGEGFKQLWANKRNSVLSIFKNIIRKDGATGLFRGIFPPVALRGISFALVIGTKNQISPRLPKALDSRPVAKAAVSGAVAVAISAVVEVPMYLVKCRQQVSNKVVDESFQNYIKTARNIVSKHGTRALYIGFELFLSLFMCRSLCARLSLIYICLPFKIKCNLKMNIYIFVYGIIIHLIIIMKQ